MPVFPLRSSGVAARALTNPFFSAATWQVRLDESGKLYEDLSHAHVESALPKRGGLVLLLRGPHKLRRGTLLERRADVARATVQLSGDLQVVTCGFDDLAEWAGAAGEGLDVADL